MGDILTALSSSSQGTAKQTQPVPLQMDTGYGLAQAIPSNIPFGNPLTPPVDPVASVDMSQQAQPMPAPVNMGQPFGAPPEAVDSAPPQAEAEPAANPYGMDINPEHMAKTVGTPNDDDEMAITGFKPKEEHGLTKVLDFFLGGAIHRGNADRNLRRSLEGFTTDPEATIRKVATFNPKAAWEMQQKYEQLHKDDEYRKARATAVTDQFRNTFGNMLGSITKSNDPDGTYANLKPVLKSWLERHELPDELPDKWDAKWADTYRYGGYKTKDQIAQESLDANRQGVLGERVRHDTVREGQMGANVSERERHDRATEGLSHERITKSPQKGQARGVMTKYGAGEISPDGNRMLIQRDGKSFRYLKVNNKWVPINKGQ